MLNNLFPHLKANLSKATLMILHQELLGQVLHIEFLKD
jgi:hypothetical protein